MLTFNEQQDLWVKEAERLISVGERRSSGCALCGTTDGEGKVFVASNQACHANLEYLPDGHKSPDFTHSYIMHGYQGKAVVREDIAVEYLDFLFHRSVYGVRGVFVEGQDPAEAYKKRIISTNTNVGANLMVSGLIATRRLSEYQHIVRNWYELKNRGVNEDFALILAHFISTSAVNEKLLTNSVGTYSAASLDSHTAISARNLESGDVRAICVDKVMRGENKRPYKKDQRYRGINDSWAGNGSFKNSKGRHLPRLTELVDGVVVKDVTVKSTINPFPPARNDRNSKPLIGIYDAFAEVAIPYFEELTA